jgi:hypothetical protein
MSIEGINTKSARNTAIGWFAGLAYFNWFASDSEPLSIIADFLLVVIGAPAACMVIGVGVALLASLVTKLWTGRVDGSPHAYASGALISPVLAFFAAEPAIQVVFGMV